MKTIYLIRHGQSTGNIKHLFCGHTDFPLSRKGKQQCLKTSQLLKSISIDLVFSSPLSRAMESAQIIFPHKIISIDERLIEINSGDADLMTATTLKRKHPDLFQSECQMDFKYPNGEATDDFFLRVNDWVFDLIIRKNCEDHVAVVAHAGVINAILHILMDIDPYTTRLPTPENASVTQLNYESDGCFKEVKLNAK